MTATKCVFAAIVLAFVVGSNKGDDPKMPDMPKPQKEHEWLKQFVGEWESDVETFMEPGKPSLKGKCTESGRLLGGFWVISEGKGEMMGMPIGTILTLGFDADKKKYVGTWVDTCWGYMWKYEGTVDASGKVLTLDTEGPCPMAPSKTAKFKEIIEFKSKDHRVFTSKMQGDDGKWTTIVTANVRRKSAASGATR